VSKHSDVIRKPVDLILDIQRGEVYLFLSKKRLTVYVVEKILAW